MNFYRISVLHRIFNYVKTKHSLIKIYWTVTYFIKFLITFYQLQKLRSGEQKCNVQ